jgi:aspartate racemase
MKTAGIIGGIAPESTIVYYREIVSSFLNQNDGTDYPKIIINSINMKTMLEFFPAKDFDGLTIYLLSEVEKLAKAGADFGVLASNTPHIIFDRLKKDSPIPLISIVEQACKKAKKLGLKKVGLFGTKFTMQNTFYNEIFAREDINLTTPDPASQEYIHSVYFGELVKGILLGTTKEKLLQIADKMRADENIDGLVLGGTELPLILKDGDRDIPFLDTTKIHVEGIIEYLTGDAWGEV